MRRNFFGLVLIIAIGAPPVFARGIQKADPIARLRLAQDIPTDIENYRFVVSTKYAIEESDKSAVRAWMFDREGKRYVVGSIAVGTEIGLDVFRRRGITNYYRVPFAQIQSSSPIQGIAPAWAWVSGHNIEVMAK